MVGPGDETGIRADTAVAAYVLFVITGAATPFGWLLGVLFGATVGAALPSLLIGPLTSWVPALAAARIAAFIGFVLLLAA